jgi:hypothetical protein
MFTPGGATSILSPTMGDGNRGSRIVGFDVLKSESETQDGHSTVVYIPPSGLQNKRQATEPTQEPSSKRSRKPSQKAKEIFIEDEVEE